MNIRMMERNSIASGVRRQPGIDHVILIQKFAVGSRARQGRLCPSCRHDPRNTLPDRCLLTSATDLISRQAPMSRGSIVANAGVESRVDHAARPGGRVVMQRPAKPCTPVRFRSWPPSLNNDGATPLLTGQYPIRLEEAFPAWPAFSDTCRVIRTDHQVVDQASGQSAAW